MEHFNDIQKGLHFAHVKQLRLSVNYINILRFLEDIQQKFAGSYFILCVLGVASLSINMFRVSNSLLERASNVIFDETL